MSFQQGPIHVNVGGTIAGFRVGLTIAVGCGLMESDGFVRFRPLADIGGALLPCQSTAMVDTEVLFRIGDAAEDEGRLDVARQSFERGAALGSVKCLTRLAYIYDVGLGIVADKQVAMRLYQKAWRQGRAIVAANNIAILYRERGNHRAMFRWFGRAADQGDGSALLDMAKCYLEGIGTSRDRSAALRCLAAAIRSIYITEAEREEATGLMSSLAPRAV